MFNIFCNDLKSAIKTVAEDFFLIFKRVVWRHICCLQNNPKPNSHAILQNYAIFKPQFLVIPLPCMESSIQGTVITVFAFSLGLFTLKRTYRPCDWGGPKIEVNPEPSWHNSSTSSKTLYIDGPKCSYLGTGAVSKTDEFS